MAIKYEDFVKSWTGGGEPIWQLGEGGGNWYGGSTGRRAELEGWGKSDPVAELRRRFGFGADVTDAQIVSWAQTNGLPDPIESDNVLKGFITDPGVLMVAGYGLAGGLTGAFDGLGSATAGASGGGGAVGGGSGQALGSGLRVGASGATGITPGVSSTGIGGGALGSGIGTTGGSLGAFAPVGSLGGALYATPAGTAGSASTGTSGVAAGAGPAGVPAFTTGNVAVDRMLSNPGLLGAVAGGALGLFGGDNEPAGTIKTESGIPDWLMPYAKPALDKYATDFQNFNVDPYGVMPAAMREYKDTLSGMYLDPSTNEWLEDYYRLGAERVKGTLSPSFGHMQAFGGHSGYNEALSRGLSDLAVGIYGGNYQKERDRQTAMTTAAPSFLQSNTQAQFSPYTTYLNTVSGLGKQQQQPYFQPNPFQNVLGGAMAGWGLGNIFK